VLLPLALVAVMWTAISVLIGDSTGSPVAYGIAAGIFFIFVVVIGFVVLQRSGELQNGTDDLENDPVITGERRGFGPLALLVLGGLLAIPFALVKGTIRVLEGIARLAPEERKDDKPAAQNRR